MGRSGREQIFIRDVPAGVRAALIERAEEGGTNMTAVAVGILAKRFDVAYEPSARKTSPAPDSTHLNLNLPAELHTRVAVSAALARRTAPRECLALLCDELGIELDLAAAAA